MKITRRSATAGIAGIFAAIVLTACGAADKTYNDGVAPVATSSSSSTPSKPTKATETKAPKEEKTCTSKEIIDGTCEFDEAKPASDSQFFDHVTTNKCDPGTAAEGFAGRIHVRATIKNILDDGDATYFLNYKVFDSKGMQVGAVGVDATTYNGPVAYGDTTQVDDFFSASTGEIPSNGRFTCKLFRIDRMVE